MDGSLYGRNGTKTVADLFEELQKGLCEVMVQANSHRRQTVSVVRLRSVTQMRGECKMLVRLSLEFVSTARTRHLSGSRASRHNALQ